MNPRRVAVAALGLLAIAGCSGTSDGDAAVFDPIGVSGPASPSGTAAIVDKSAPAVGEVQAAVEAVLALHPNDPVEFTEINVQHDLVNVFVALPEATELGYVWQSGALQIPASPQPQIEGAEPFGLDGVDLLSVPPAIVERLRRELPNSAAVQLTLVVSSELGLSWTATLIGEKGQPFAVAFSLAGEIIGAVPGG